MSRSLRTTSAAPAQSTDEAFEFTQHGRAYLLYSQGRSARRFMDPLTTPEDLQDPQILLRPTRLLQMADLIAGSRAQTVTGHEGRSR